jgi:hypothetical protein
LDFLDHWCCVGKERKARSRQRASTSSTV